MTSLASDLPPVAPLQAKPLVLWMGFNRDTDLDAATKTFVERHGYEPLSWQRTGGGLLLERRGE